MTPGGRVGRILAFVVAVCAARPVVTVVVALVLAAGGAAYTWRALSFVTSNLRLLPQHERYVVLMREYLRDFGELNDIVVAVEAPTPDVAKVFAARLAGDLRQGGLDARITYRIDPAYFEQRGLLYLSVDELTRLRDRLFDYEEFVETYAGRPTLPQLLESLNQQLANAMVSGFFDLGLAGDRSSDLRFLESVIEQTAAAAAGTPLPFVSPWSAAFSLGRLDDPDAGYFFSSDRRTLFLFVQQRRQEGDFTDNRGRIAAIRAAVARLAPAYPGVAAGVTGAPAISNDEMATAFADSELATLLAVGGTLVLLLLAFRRIGAPLLMLTSLGVSLLWSMGVVTLTVGHLSIFSVMFISIVLGIGIDYGIYFLFRYDEELKGGAGHAAALARTAERTGPGMLLGALTAAGAFFVLMLTDFQGIREFGFVAGLAIFMAFVAMVTLFPALLVLADRRSAATWTPRTSPPSAHAPSGWLMRITRYRGTILAAAVSLTALALWTAPRVDFNYNMLALQAHGVESVAWEERILARAGRSGFTALATAPTLEELARKQDAFAALPTVSKVESVLLVVPERQDEKIRLIAQFAPLVGSVRPRRLPAELDPAALRAPLETLRRRLGIIAAEAGDEKARAEVGRVRDRVDGVLRTLAGGDPGARPRQALERLQAAVARDFADKLDRFRSSLSPRPIAAADIPPELRDRYVGQSGRFLLRIHPAVDIWQRPTAERFVRSLRGVDPDVTGPPVTSYEAIRYVRHGYYFGTLCALLLVGGVTLAVLRSVVGMLVALTPLGLGVLWTLGSMHLLGLEFNLANVWALPLIIGTSAEFGLNLFVRFLEEREGGGPLLARSVVMAVVLNGVTTLAGFASLLVAHHRGIFGLGMLLTIGVTTALVASLAVLPVLLRLLFKDPPARAPRTAGAVAAEVPAGGAAR